MFLMYVDESGDIGLNRSPSRYFILTGLVIHELRWQPYLAQIVQFRREMKNQFGLKLREEIHAASFITRPGSFSRIKRNDRLTIIRKFADELASMPDLNIINIVIDKSSKPADYDVFNMAWKLLIQRFENTLSRRNFRGPANSDERGLMLPDNTDNAKLMRQLRKMRVFNPVPHNQQILSTYNMSTPYRNLVVGGIIEDPAFRNSEQSYFVQACDLCAYLLHQQLAPNSYMRKKGGYKYFDRLDDVLCKVASTGDKQGIVRY